MKNFALIVFLLVIQSFATTYVAVVETISENGVIGRSEKMYLTDKLREHANTALPAYMDFSIMTRENINAMLPPGKALEDCEGSCLAETGRNISADYIAQARVGKFGNSFTLTVELYETRSGKLLGSITARSEQAEGLLDVIENKAEGLFSKIVQKNVSGSYSAAEGFSSVDMGEKDYKAVGVKSFIIMVTSSPDGAVFSIDGRPNASCSKTPCSVLLNEGPHSFSFIKESHVDKDTVFNVSAAGGRLSVKLVTKYGLLNLAPGLYPGIGSLEELQFTIDGNKVKGNNFRLDEGAHKVSIMHACYEPASFTVNVKNGSYLKFDKALIARKAGLELNAVEGGKPKNMPVFINGIQAGSTPFLETLPVCSKVAIGEKKEIIPIKLEPNKTELYI